MKTINWPVYIKTVSEANCSEHWSHKRNRHKSQQQFVKLSFDKYGKNITLPCEVTLTRISPLRLDDDNLVMCFKWIRDELSECILPDMRKTYTNRNGKLKTLKGRADSDKRIKWRYDQKQGEIQRVEIEIKCDD